MNWQKLMDYMNKKLLQGVPVPHPLRSLPAWENQQYPFLRRPFFKRILKQKTKEISTHGQKIFIIADFKINTTK